MIIFGFWREFYVSLAMMFMLGLVPPFWIAGIRTILQTSIPDEMRGRVMAVFLLAMQLFGLGWALGGAMAEAVGAEATLAAGGLLFILLNLLAYARSATLRNA